MNLTVGRVVLPDTDINWDVDGDSVRVSGSTTGLTREAATDLRAQLLGYVSNPDEAFVPVLSDVESEFNGFYRVTAASVGGAGYDAFSGRTQWSLSLDKVMSFASPMVEVTTIGGPRQNVHSWDPNSDVNPLLFLPPTAAEVVNVIGGVKYPIQNARTVLGAGVSARIVNYGFTGSARTLYSVSPVQHYSASPVLRGVNGETIVGRQTELYLDSGSFTLDNGFTQCSIRRGTGTTWQELGLTLAIRSGAGGSWGSETEYRIARPDSSPYVVAWDQIGPIRVLRNSPEVVSVRVSALRLNYYTRPIVMDVTLRRGDPFVSCRIHRFESTQTDIAANIGVWSPAATGGTLTSGRYISSGRLFVSPQALSVSGGVFTPGGTTPKDADWDFAIGAATITDTGGSAIDAWKIYAFATAQQQAVVVP